ncbi:MAG: SpoIIE family protein phosphatase [Spirochaetes bacterium]|nr:SpoIIE family protein phosphatase [Spirochaetota bacterium]
MKKILFGIIALLLIVAAPLSAAPLTLGTGDSYAVPAEIMRDEKGSLTFEDIRNSASFVKTTKNALGFINDVIWARFTVVVPEGNETEWFLEIGYPLLNSIDIYIPDANHDYTKRHFGNKIPFDKRDINHHNFLIRLSRDPGTYTYYVRFQSESSMNIPMTIHSLKNVISDINIQKTIFGLFYGALLIILVYNLLLAISMKDITYLSYAVFIAALVLVSLELNGYGFQYIWKNTMLINDLVPFFLFMTNLTLTIFSILYIDYRLLPKYFRITMMAYIVTIGTSLILSLILPYHISIMAGAAAYLPGIALVTVIAITLIIKKRREANWYAIAWSFLFAGVILTVGNRFGVLPNSFLTLWGFQIGTVFSIALFSLGLADRVNTLKNNLEEMNVNLEKKVEERTRELSQAKTETEATMEELEAINDQLIHSNRDLEDSQMVYRKDMNMAAYLQSSLLPKKPPHSDMYDFALLFLPKAGVSGDFYDFYMDGDRVVGVGIFDVSGHGIAPGLLTLMAKSIISVNFMEHRNASLATVVENINSKLITEIKDVDNYLTGVMLRFDGDRIEYINCAHPDVICKKTDIDRTGKVLDKTGKRVSGPILGIDSQGAIDKVGFDEISFKLKQGDSLLLYTDSMIESTNSEGKAYGETMIMKSLQNAGGETAQEILNSIIGDFFNYIAPREITDDLTVILIRKK